MLQRGGFSRNLCLHYSGQNRVYNDGKLHRRNLPTQQQLSGARPARGRERKYLFSTTWPSAALVVFDNVAELSTLTLVAMVSTESSTSIVAYCWTCNGNAARE